MIQKIINLNLNYRENIMLCHTIFTKWAHSTVDYSSISEEIYNLAEQFSKEYPKEQYEDDLLKFIDKLNDNEYEIIKQKRNNRTLIPANMLKRQF